MERVQARPQGMNAGGIWDTREIRPTGTLVVILRRIAGMAGMEGV